MPDLLASLARLPGVTMAQRPKEEDLVCLAFLLVVGAVVLLLFARLGVLTPRRDLHG
jgi:hypothetical protein